MLEEKISENVECNDEKKEENMKDQINPKNNSNEACKGKISESESDKYKEVYKKVQSEIKDIIIDRLLAQIIYNEQEKMTLIEENNQLKGHLYYLLKKMIVNQRNLPTTLGSTKGVRKANGLRINTHTENDNSLDIAAKNFKDNIQFQTKLLSYINSLSYRQVPSNRIDMIDNSYFSTVNKDLHKMLSEKNRSTSCLTLNTESVTNSRYKTLERNSSQHEMISDKKRKKHGLNLSLDKKSINFDTFNKMKSPNPVQEKRKIVITSNTKKAANPEKNQMTEPIPKASKLKKQVKFKK